MQIDALAAQVNSLADVVTHLTQPGPNVTGRASALVALAKDSRIDGRVGVGDVTVAVMLSGGGVAIGIFGALTAHLGSIDIISAGEAISLGGLTGCGLGLARLGIDALGLPAAASWFLDWTHDTLVDMIAARSNTLDIDEPEPRVIRQIPYAHSKKTSSLSIDVGPAQVWTLQIPSRNLKDGWRDIAWPDVRTFIHAACATGNWTRDKQTVLDQKTHADLKDYLEDRDGQYAWPVPMWGFTDSPARSVVLEILRNKLTNGNARTGTNGGTGG